MKVKEWFQEFCRTAGYLLCLAGTGMLAGLKFDLLMIFGIGLVTTIGAIVDWAYPADILKWVAVILAAIPTALALVWPFTFDLPEKRQPKDWDPSRVDQDRQTVGKVLVYLVLFGLVAEVDMFVTFRLLEAESLVGTTLYWGFSGIFAALAAIGGVLRTVNPNKSRQAAGFWLLSAAGMIFIWTAVGLGCQMAIEKRVFVDFLMGHTLFLTAVVVLLGIGLLKQLRETNHIRKKNEEMVFALRRMETAEAAWQQEVGKLHFTAELLAANLGCRDPEQILHLLDLIPKGAQYSSISGWLQVHRAQLAEVAELPEPQAAAEGKEEPTEPDGEVAATGVKLDSGLIESLVGFRSVVVRTELSIPELILALQQDARLADCSFALVDVSPPFGWEQGIEKSFPEIPPSEGFVWKELYPDQIVVVYGLEECQLTARLGYSKDNPVISPERLADHAPVIFVLGTDANEDMLHPWLANAVAKSSGVYTIA